MKPGIKLMAVFVIGIMAFSMAVSSDFFTEKELGIEVGVEEINEVEEITGEANEFPKRSVPPAYTYNRQAAYGYAKKWWDGRNSHYTDFSSMGGDCANFVSQCLIAGGLSLHEGTNGGGYGVYPDRDRSLSSYGTIPYCDYMDTNLRNYQSSEVTYVTDGDPYVPSNIGLGDAVIFGDKNGDKYKHAMVVVSDSGSTVGVSGHSSNVWDRDFFTELSYFSCATFYHFPVNTAEYHHFKVTTSTLNVRVGPGTNEQGNYYEDVGDLPGDGEYVAFGSELDENGKKWWHFWFQDRPAWCASWYTAETAENAVFEVDTAAYLNVRSGASTSNSIVGQVYDGMRFVAYGQSGDWWQYYYGGGTGYSHSSYTTLLEGTPSGGGTQGGETDGIDVSHWQGSIDWEKVYQDGYKFAFCKATEGTTYVDDTFSGHMADGRAAGLYMGAYHFARPTRNTAEAEASHFSSVISSYLGSGYLRPVLDLEDGSSLGKSALSTWVRDFQNAVISDTGLEPIIYCNANYAGNYLETSINTYDLWVAHYTSASGPSTGIWSTWSFWQYTDQGSVDGISGSTVDLDIYNGDLSSLVTNFGATGGTSPSPNEAPVAEAGSDRSGKAGDTFTFDGTGSYDTDGTISSYAWNFGDGGSAQGSSVEHQYSSAGTYTVTLEVTDDDGESSTDTCTVIISSNQAPVADAGSDKTAGVGETVNFDGTGSDDPDGTISSHAWNFGDGGSAQGSTASHSYSSAGLYTVTLTVTDNDGAQSTDTAAVNVQAQQVQPPVADAGTDQTVSVNSNVNFDGSGSYDPNGNIVSYQWDFGDGNTDTGPRPTHVYSNSGTYTVTLTVTDNNGNTDTDTCKVIVNNQNSTPGFEMNLVLLALGACMLVFLLGRRR